MPAFTTRVVILSGLLGLASALYTAKGSPCAIDCDTQTANFTGTGDLICLDTAYSDTTKGTLFKSCLQCLSTSNYYNSSLPTYADSDQWWYLWHMKYAQQYCLVDNAQTNAATSCSSECSPMKSALDVSWIYQGVQQQYGYCSFNESEYTTFSEGCAQCLLSQTGGVILGNFATAMNGACSSKPFISTGATVSTARDLFDSSTIGSASPSTSSASSAATTTSTSTTSGSTVIGTTTNTATSQTGLPTSGVASTGAKASSGLSTGAAVGIGVGIGIGGVAVLVAVAAFFLMRRRRKNTVSEVPADVKPDSYQPSQMNTSDGPPKYISTAYTELGTNTHPSDSGTAEVYGHGLHEADDGRATSMPVELPGARN